MYVKIYFNNKPLYLCDETDKHIEELLHHDDTMFIDEFDAHTVRTMIFEMEQPQVHAGVFKHHDLEELKKAVFKKFQLIRAGGGVVENDEKELLMIFRKGKWDLPKGKLDAGEKIEDCAVREIKEETGLKTVQLKELLLTTYHTYHEGTRSYLKETSWYKMHAPGKQEIKAQTEEQITDIKWVNKKELDKYLRETFVLIRDVIEKNQER